jgi:uncharacterized membrane protein YgcG
MTHLDEMTCLQYLEGLLDRERAEEISHHAESCIECGQLMRALESESQLLSAALKEQEESVPARLLSPEMRERTPWAWIASFGLAAAGIYWLWGFIIDPWQQQLQSAGLGETDLLTTLLFRGEPWNWWQSIWTVMQVMAAISLGIVGFYLVRRSLRRWHTVALVMPALVFGLLMPGGVSAVEEHHNEANYTLPAGQTVNDDLLIGGASVRIAGTVQGDVIFGGNELNISGHVTGDVLFSGSLLTISGTVDGNIRGAGSYVTITGKVGKNVMFFGGTIELSSTGEVGQDVFMLGGQLMVDGHIGRDLFAHDGRINIEGTVGRNVQAHVTDEFRVGPGATIQGTTKLSAVHQPDVAAGAKLGSPIDVTIRAVGPRYTSGSYYWHLALSWGAAFIFGMLLIILFREFFAQIAAGTERFASFGLGLLLLIAVPIVCVVICFTVVGIPISISSLFLYLIAVYSAKTFVAVWLGQKMMGDTLSVPGLIGRLAAGLVIVYALEEIPYHIGFFVWVIVVSFGLGALSIATFRHMRQQPTAGIAVPA